MKRLFNNFNERGKGKRRISVVSLLLAVSILLNLYQYGSKPVEKQQNSLSFTTSQDYQKKIDSLNNEKKKLETQASDALSQKEDAENKLKSALEENKNLNLKLSQDESQSNQQQAAAPVISQQVSSAKPAQNDRKNITVYVTRLGKS